MNNISTNKINEIAINAGAEILNIYSQADFGIEYKEDDSPLTIADQKAHEIIQAGLKELYPEIPILSEEGKDISFEERKNWEVFWCVDPLDGTKEFINKNGEFTINIALIENKTPVWGVIYAPAYNPENLPKENSKFEGTLYFTDKGKSFKQLGNGETSELPLVKNENKKVAVRSRSHAKPEEETVFNEHGVTETISAGSSLKFCMAAEGKADLYYRHGPTMEWDTAAGHAISLCSGLSVEGLTYNKVSLKNNSFLVIRK